MTNRHTNNTCLNLLRISNAIGDIPSFKYKREFSSGSGYHGFAEPGAGTGDSEWMIVKETGTGENNWSSGELTFASGNRNFDKIWDNRDTYTYS